MKHLLFFLARIAPGPRLPKPGRLRKSVAVDPTIIRANIFFLLGILIALLASVAAYGPARSDAPQGGWQPAAQSVSSQYSGWPIAEGDGIAGTYLLSFQACDAGVSNCSDPRNHRVYLFFCLAISSVFLSIRRVKGCVVAIRRYG
jgi:hypothetical protein